MRIENAWIEQKLDPCQDFRVQKEPLRWLENLSATPQHHVWA